MMSQHSHDRIADGLAELLRPLVRTLVMQELEPFRELLVHPAADDAPAVAELVDAVEVARLMGEDLSTEKKKKAACQRVYDLARKGLIPSVRVSPRRVRFDPAAVKRAFAQGGLAKPYSPTPAQQKACASSRR